MLDLSNVVFTGIDDEFGLALKPGTTGTSKIAVLHLCAPELFNVEHNFTEDHGQPVGESYIQVGIPFEVLDLIAKHWPEKRRSLEVPE